MAPHGKHVRRPHGVYLKLKDLHTYAEENSRIDGLSFSWVDGSSLDREPMYDWLALNCEHAWDFLLSEIWFSSKGDALKCKLRWA
jgi:hypothetical protein